MRAEQLCLQMNDLGRQHNLPIETFPPVPGDVRCHISAHPIFITSTTAAASASGVDFASSARSIGPSAVSGESPM